MALDAVEFDKVDSVFVEVLSVDECAMDKPGIEAADSVVGVGAEIAEEDSWVGIGTRIDGIVAGIGCAGSVVVFLAGS